MSASGNMTEKTQAPRTRRAAIGGIGAGLAGAALAATMTPVPAQSERKTFVLVHGSSAGGWCYRRVADLLEHAVTRCMRRHSPGLANAPIS